MTSKANDPHRASNEATARSEAFGVGGQADHGAEIPPQVLESVILILEGLGVWEQKLNRKGTPDEEL